MKYRETTFQMDSSYMFPVCYLWVFLWVLEAAFTSLKKNVHVSIIGKDERFDSDWLLVMFLAFLWIKKTIWSCNLEDFTELLRHALFHCQFYVLFVHFFSSLATCSNSKAVIDVQVCIKKYPLHQTHLTTCSHKMILIPSVHSSLFIYTPNNLAL